jgi:hypothetical protein
VGFILAVALIASQTTYYEAKVASFGCTSIDAVSELQKVRSTQFAQKGNNGAEYQTRHTIRHHT